MGSKGTKQVTVGYRYSWDIHAGLGRGPVDELVAITADKKTVFAGMEGEIRTSAIIPIYKPNLFGGDDTGGEGGIEGTLEVMMGTSNQVPSAALKGLLKGLVPGFRGIVTTFFSGVISSYSASPKPWSYRVRRSTKGWDGLAWYPEKGMIRLENAGAQLDDMGSLSPAVIANLRTIKAMNPAHILVQCATDRTWGRGLSLDTDLDIDSYRRAADTLFSEGFGLCFRYNRQDSLDTFIQQMLDHIGAAQYGDLSTGKMTLKLIRADYNPDDLPLFTYDNGIIAVQDDDSVGSDSAPNEIVVTYHDPVTNTDGEVRVQNLGAIQSVGLISSTVDYKAIPTHGLAERVASRDLEMGAAGISRLVIQFDRRGGQLLPAGCFRVSLPDRSIDNMVLRVSKIAEADNGTLTITAIQDVFGLPATVYTSGQQDSLWTPPDKTALPVTDMQLIELPYVVLAGTLSVAALDYLRPEIGYVGVMASAPNAMAIDFLVQSRAQGDNFIVRADGDWTVSGELQATVEPTDTLFSVAMPSLPNVGSAALIGTEIVRIDATDIANSTLTVARGGADTLPALHLAGTQLRFFRGAIESDDREYLVGELVDVRLLTRTSANTLPAALAPISRLIMRQRHYRPYLPGNIQINGVLYPLTVDAAGSYILSWSHRDRLLQADRLIDCREGSIGPEPGVSYVVTLINQTTQVVWQIPVALETLTLPYVSDSAGAIHSLTLQAIRSGITSLYTWQTTLPAGRYEA